MRLFNQSSTGTAVSHDEAGAYFIYGVYLFQLVSWSALACWCHYFKKKQPEPTPEVERIPAPPASENQDVTSSEVPYRLI